jgi:hypothetical protein
MTRRSLIAIDPSIRPQPGEQAILRNCKKIEYGKGQFNSKYATTHITHN